MKIKYLGHWLVFFFFMFHNPGWAQSKTVYLDELDLSNVSQGWSTVQKNKNLLGGPIKMDGKVYKRGIATHAKATIEVATLKHAERFEAIIGYDDTMAHKKGNPGFIVITADEKVIYHSDTFTTDDKPRKVSLDVKGKDIITIEIFGIGGWSKCHFDLGDARFEGVTGKLVTTFADEKPYYLSPEPGPEPHFNGAARIGMSPGKPFMYRIPVSGKKPVNISAENLPNGLVLDEKTGIISGHIHKPGKYAVNFQASNASGKAGKTITFVVGDTIALTPPMGWNSWNCWGGDVDAGKIEAGANSLISTGLADFGWRYVNIDDAWQGKRGGHEKALGANAKFPEIKTLADKVHSLGLQIGLYSTPWVESYMGETGGSADAADGTVLKPRREIGLFTFEGPDARQFAAWGFDYLKYDWSPIDTNAILRMKSALRSTNRDIVYSLSNGTNFELAGRLTSMANLWRTTGDIIDTWPSVSEIGFAQSRWAPFCGPGHFNDPDMLVVGNVGWGSKTHKTRLSYSEQYSHISLWALLNAPLLLGCDLTKLDKFTLNLLTNSEVLEIDQDEACKQATCILKEGHLQVWSKPMHDGSTAIGYFNLGYVPFTLKNHSLTQLGLNGNFRIRDVWRQIDTNKKGKSVSGVLPPHGVMLYRLFPVK